MEICCFMQFICVFFFMRRVLIGIPEIIDRQKLSAKCGGWLPMSWLLVMHVPEGLPSPQTKQHKLWPLLLILYQKLMVRPTAEDTPYLRHRTWKVRLLLPRSLLSAGERSRNREVLSRMPGLTTPTVLPSWELGKLQQ